MTQSLFSQLVSELSGDLGPTGLQRRLLSRPASETTPAQRAALAIYWGNFAASRGLVNDQLNPTTILAVMAGLPEVQDMTDDFFFI